MPNDLFILSRVLQFMPFGEIFRRPPPPLIDRGFGLIYDTERDITWLQDVNYAATSGHSRDGQMTWPDAMRFVQSLYYRGIRGWRLPNARNPDGSGPETGSNAIGSELGHLYLDVFAHHPGIVTLKNGVVPCIFWTGTEANAEEAYAFDLFNLRQGSLWKDPFVERFGVPPLFRPVFAWPVHDGDVAAELRTRVLQRLLTSIVSLFRR